MGHTETPSVHPLPTIALFHYFIFSPSKCRLDALIFPQFSYFKNFNNTKKFKNKCMYSDRSYDNSLFPWGGNQVGSAHPSEIRGLYGQGQQEVRTEVTAGAASLCWWKGKGSYPNKPGHVRAIRSHSAQGIWQRFQWHFLKLHQDLSVEETIILLWSPQGLNQGHFPHSHESEVSPQWYLTGSKRMLFTGEGLDEARGQRGGSTLAILWSF